MAFCPSMAFIFDQHTGPQLPDTSDCRGCCACIQICSKGARDLAFEGASVWDPWRRWPTFAQPCDETIKTNFESERPDRYENNEDTKWRFICEVEHRLSGALSAEEAMHQIQIEDSQKRQYTLNGRNEPPLDITDREMGRYVLLKDFERYHISGVGEFPTLMTNDAPLHRKLLLKKYKKNPKRLAGQVNTNTNIVFATDRKCTKPYESNPGELASVLGLPTWKSDAQIVWLEYPKGGIRYHLPTAPDAGYRPEWRPSTAPLSGYAFHLRDTDNRRVAPEWVHQPFDAKTLLSFDLVS